MLEHLEALQAIADENGGTRSVGTPGYDISVEYVAGVLEDAGYDIATPAAGVPVYEPSAPSVLERLEPSPTTWTDGEDFRAMLFSGSGDVEGTIAAVDGDGCASADFAGFPEGGIALIGPGNCFRRDQISNAQSAGAVGFIGVTTALPGRPLRPTLITPEGIDVPALAVTSILGAELDPGDVVRLSVEGSSSFDVVRSVIAATPGAPPVGVVMLGGHLDSALDGPGINDNGTGVALLLELATWLAAEDPDAPVAFAFWGGEEVGLYGSRDYVADLDPGDLEAIRIYLNLDMVGSPNFATFVYEAGPGAPPIAREAAEVLEDALDDLGFESEPLDLEGGSDHASFQSAGVATGGLYSGSLERKTAAQADAYGGEAREPLDACYHQPCDTIDNVSRTALRRHALAMVALLRFLLG
jgi:Zn-dependent M28 family amino/carboxypeptidase